MVLNDPETAAGPRSSDLNRLPSDPRSNNRRFEWKRHRALAAEVKINWRPEPLRAH